MQCQLKVTLNKPASMQDILLLWKLRIQSTVQQTFTKVLDIARIKNFMKFKKENTKFTKIKNVMLFSNVTILNCDRYKLKAGFTCIQKQ